MRHLIIVLTFVILCVVAIGAWCDTGRENAMAVELKADRYVTYRVTAYCPCEKCCGRWSDGYTASGVKAEGLIAAAPPEVPFGTVVDVPGYGRAVVRDRGGSIKGRRFDVLFPTHKESLEWGVKYLKIKESW